MFITKISVIAGFPCVCVCVCVCPCIYRNGHAQARACRTMCKDRLEATTGWFVVSPQKAFIYSSSFGEGILKQALKTEHRSTPSQSNGKTEDSREGTICSVCESRTQPELESESPASRRVTLGEVDMKSSLANKLQISDFAHHLSFQITLFQIYIKVKYIFYIQNVNITKIPNKESK